MDYEKKYKEALERARQFSEKPYLEDSKGIVDYIFPELKESDDERIRKVLIELVHDTTGDSLWVDYNVHKEDALAWLEKQGEHANFRNKIQIGDKVTRNEAGILVNISQLNRVAKPSKRQSEQKPADEDIKEVLHTEYEKGRADVIAEMQKPAWSEEDKAMVEDIIEAIDTQYAVTDYNEMVNWLKSIKDRTIPQPKQEWSEEDEKILSSIIEDYTEKVSTTLSEEISSHFNKCIDWLKSLRPQNRWKPTEENIRDLEWCAFYVEKNTGSAFYRMKVFIDELKSLK